MWHESVTAVQTYRALSCHTNPASWPRDMVALCAVVAQPGQHCNLLYHTPHRSCSSKTLVTELRSLVWPTSSKYSTWWFSGLLRRKCHHQPYQNRHKHGQYEHQTNIKKSTRSNTKFKYGGNHFAAYPLMRTLCGHGISGKPGKDTCI